MEDVELQGDVNRQRLARQAFSLRKGLLPTIETCGLLQGIFTHLSLIPFREIPEYGALEHHFFSPGLVAEELLPHKRYCRVPIGDTICLHALGPSTSSSIALRHIRNKHSPTMQALDRFRDRQDRQLVESRAPKQQQLTLPESQDRAKALPPPEYKDRQFRRLIINLIVKALLPISIVEPFKELFDFLGVLYPIPSRITINNDMALWLASLSNDIEDSLATCSKGSFTADAWTSRGNDKFLGVTFHWVTKAFVPVEVLIGMNVMNVSHSAEALQPCLDAILTRWKLQDTIMMGTTDSATNIKAAMMGLSQKYPLVKFPCAAHLIQLYVNSALAEVEDADAVLNKCHELTHLMKQIGAFREAVKTQQQEADPMHKPLTFVDDIIMRWNFQYNMIKRVICLYHFILAVRNDIRDTDRRRMDNGCWRAWKEPC